MVAGDTPERIDEIEALENELTTKRQQRRDDDPKFAEKQRGVAALKGDRPLSFFLHHEEPDSSIRAIVEWSKTSHGGKQFELFEPDTDAGCMRWGLCDHPPDPPSE